MYSKFKVSKHVFLAISYIIEKIREEVKELRTLELSPKNVESYLAMAELAWKMKNFENAKKMLFKVLELNPQNNKAKSMLFQSLSRN